jgi:hypothetical protein
LRLSLPAMYPPGVPRTSIPWWLFVMNDILSCYERHNAPSPCYGASPRNAVARSAD